MKKILLIILSTFVLASSTYAEEIDLNLTKPDPPAVKKEEKYTYLLEFDQLDFRDDTYPIHTPTNYGTENVYMCIKFDIFDVFNSEKYKRKLFTKVTRTKNPVSKKKLGLRLRFALLYVNM